MTLPDYVGVLRRRRWVVVSVLVIVPLLALALTLRVQPVYQASADVLLNHRNLSASLAGVVDPAAVQQPDRIAATQADLARVPQVAQRALTSAGLPDRSPLDLLQASTVSPRADADLLGFEVRDSSPATASRLATAYAKAFIAYGNALESDAVDRARASIQKRLERLAAGGEGASPLAADLIVKQQKLAAIEALATTSAFLVRPAGVPDQIEPRPMRNLLLGIGFGVVLAIGLAFLVEALDTRVSTPDETERLLRLPLLAKLPKPGPEPNGYAEAIRMLRVRLEHARSDPEVRVVMVTSAAEGEGKSTTVANLAIALAQAGRRVVLCDLDARHPVVDRLFGMQGRPGLTEVVLGQLDLPHALILTARNGYGGTLEILALGNAPPDPGELAGSRRVASILQALRERADVVLVDAPSVLGLGDAMTLSHAVDAVLVVTRLGALRRATLDELCRVLERCPARKLGLVLTGASERLDPYGRGYARSPVPGEPPAQPVASR
jgi:tyrosine-protein kinase